MTSHIGLTSYAGPAGDHNDRAMQAVRVVGEAMARWLNVDPVVIGLPVPSDPQSWDVELERVRRPLGEMAARIDAHADINVPGDTATGYHAACAVRKSSQVRFPTARLEARLAPLRKARPALPWDASESSPGVCQWP